MENRYKFTGTGNNGTLGWMLQRVSAVILMFALTFHIGGRITGAYNDMNRLVLGFVLIFGVFHAVNGLKMITDDYVSGIGKRFILLLIYWAVGVAMIILGLSLLP